MQAKAPHIPVMIHEVLKYLAPKDGGIYVDATFGAGGYSKAILDHANCNVIGLDRDENVMPFVYDMSEKYSTRFRFIKSNFGALSEAIEGQKIDGVVFDIGVSSMQLDTKDRGFSFMHDAALDMRMDQKQSFKAYDIVNFYSEAELANIIYNYGGERKSRAIAKAIINYRHTAKIETTLQLAEIVKNAVKVYRDDINPATRTFQALRIVVNQELDELKKSLKGASGLLNKDGKIVVVAFHSLEDAITKAYFQELCGKRVHVNKYAPENAGHVAHENKFELLTKKAITPTRQEVLSNNRSRSAKLRAIRRCA